MHAPALLCAALIGASLFPTAAREGRCAATHEHEDIVATARAAGQFKTLSAALEAAGLVGMLEGQGPFTVFAPTDEAFARLPEGELAKWLKPESKAALSRVLAQHVLPGRFSSGDLADRRFADVASGQRVAIHAAEGALTVGGARVVKADVAASNGVIHAVDRVLMPALGDLTATARAAGTFRTLLAAAEAAGVAGMLAEGGPYTLLAPDDAAFAKLPAGTVEAWLRPENKESLKAVLQRHVISGRAFAIDVVKMTEVKPLAGAPIPVRQEGGVLRLCAAKVTTADVQAANGVIHVLDTVLMPGAGR